ncbi:hypothetical protein DFH07DRAFT_783226 [Mycena maculata]|uniref:Uncharacterized protein n=1 Tax=Mycena maculata TaxID=230809 RepID=A0AAD7MMT2_9AGAR|nr:hypothetical protein DFH07DRAFT_783226 [Mycena maculata]
MPLDSANLTCNVASDIPLDQLKVSAEQRAALEDILKRKDRVYSWRHTNNGEEQWRVASPNEDVRTMGGASQIGKVNIAALHWDQQHTIFRRVDTEYIPIQWLFGTERWLGGIKIYTNSRGFQCKGQPARAAPKMSSIWDWAVVDCHRRRLFLQWAFQMYTKCRTVEKKDNVHFVPLPGQPSRLKMMRATCFRPKRVAW